MNRSDLIIELEQQIAAYWASVDRIRGDRPDSASFYALDGEMQLGDLRLRGRTEIAAFFRERNRTEIDNRRTTRHVMTNMLVESNDGSRAIAYVLMLVYSGRGDWPLPSRAPSAVGDFEFRFVRCSDGWLMSRVCGTTVFIGEGAPRFAATD